jgi:hypothetical protein
MNTIITEGTILWFRLVPYFVLEMSTEQSLSCSGNVIYVLFRERRNDLDRLELLLLPVGIARGSSHQSCLSPHATHYSRDKASLRELSIPSK